MSAQSKEELLKGYEEARQKVENIKNSWISEQVQDKKFNHHSS